MPGLCPLGGRALFAVSAMICGLRQAALWYKAWWLVALEDPRLWILPGQTSFSVGLGMLGQARTGWPWLALWVRCAGSSLSSRLMVFGEGGLHGIVAKSFALEGPEFPHGRGSYSPGLGYHKGGRVVWCASLHDRHWPQ